MRVRKHANPLNCRKEIDKLQCEKVYKDQKLPLGLEIGFAQGEFLLETAKQYPNMNYVGIEVRKPLANKLNKTAKEQNYSNLHFLHGSSSYHLNIIPNNSVEKIFVFFPDPWFKTKHHKRRIISKKFLEEIPAILADNHFILFQTDVLDLYLDTLSLIKQNDNYQIMFNEEDSYSINETGIPSYFEQRCIDNNWPIYRIKFRYSK